MGVLQDGLVCNTAVAKEACLVDPHSMLRVGIGPQAVMQQIHFKYGTRPSPDSPVRANKLSHKIVSPAEMRDHTMQTDRLMPQQDSLIPSMHQHRSCTACTIPSITLRCRSRTERNDGGLAWLTPDCPENPHIPILPRPFMRTQCLLKSHYPKAATSQFERVGINAHSGRCMHSWCDGLQSTGSFTPQLSAASAACT